MNDCFGLAVGGLLEDGAEGAGVVAGGGVDAEVPDRLVDVGRGDDFNQRVLADRERLKRLDFEPVLAGHYFNLGGDDVFVLGDGA